MESIEIKEIRERLGLTQQAFAHELGVAFATVSRWENGHKKPSGLAMKALERMRRKAEKQMATA